MIIKKRGSKKKINKKIYFFQMIHIYQWHRLLQPSIRIVNILIFHTLIQKKKNLFLGISFIHKDSEIGDNCIIGSFVKIGPGVKIGSNCIIGDNVSIYYSIISDNVKIYNGARIGGEGFGFISSKNFLKRFLN